MENKIILLKNVLIQMHKKKINLLLMMISNLLHLDPLRNLDLLDQLYPIVWNNNVNKIIWNNQLQPILWNSLLIPDNSINQILAVIIIEDWLMNRCDENMYSIELLSVSINNFKSICNEYNKKRSEIIEMEKIVNNNNKENQNIINKSHIILKYVFTIKSLINTMIKIVNN